MSRLRTWTKPENQRLVHISIDNSLWGTLPARVLLPYCAIEEDREAEDEEIDRIKGVIRAYARDQLFDYLAKAEHSEYACRNYLKTKKYHREITDVCIAEAKEKKYLSDTRYAELYIRSLLDAGKSRRHIIAKLRTQKIPSDVYEPLFEELIDPDTSLENLTAEIVRMRITHAEMPYQKLKDKIFSSLYRKGWELDTIRKAWERSGARSDD